MAATLELGWDALMAHLRALTPDAARAIDRVEILVPLPQLEKINIVDTPGLNSIQPEHEATARAFIAKADAVVWMFTAAQGGKASEKKALQSIRDEGKRVLGVLNKADQLERRRARRGDRVHRRRARRARRGDRAGVGARGDGWKRDRARRQLARADRRARAAVLPASARAQARCLCARVARRDRTSRKRRSRPSVAQESAAVVAAHAGRDELEASARAFADQAVVAERKELSEQMVQLYRRASREVLDLVRPRRLPFSSHTATAADREYLLALLSSGFESAIEGGKKRVAADLAKRSRSAEAGARALGALLGTDVVGDLERVAADRIGLAMARVFDRARAYLRGYLEGGYVDSFFRNDVPRLELVRGRDLSRAVSFSARISITRSASRSRTPPSRRSHAIAARLDHWSAVASVQAFDLDVGVARALELAAARLRD